MTAAGSMPWRAPAGLTVTTHLCRGNFRSYDQRAKLDLIAQVAQDVWG
jgi:hypothetical protein